MLISNDATKINSEININLHYEEKNYFQLIFMFYIEISCFTMKYHVFSFYNEISQKAISLIVNECFLDES